MKAKPVPVKVCFAVGILSPIFFRELFPDRWKTDDQMFIAVFAALISMAVFWGIWWLFAKVVNRKENIRDAFEQEERREDKKYL